MTDHGEKIIDFMTDPKSRAHPSGITPLEFLRMDSDEFESRHDVIQWMFPTLTQSKAQPHSPFLSLEDMPTFVRKVPRSGWTYQFTEYYRNFLEESPDIWLVNYDHNHLRITRAIESLTLSEDGHNRAYWFHAHVVKLNAKAGWPVNIKSTEFWKKALYYDKEQGLGRFCIDGKRRGGYLEGKD